MSRIAVVQMASGPDVERNLREVGDLAAAAARDGAQLVATPENTCFMGEAREKLRIAEPVEGAMGRRLGEIARLAHCWLLVGSFPERADGARTHNTSLLFDAAGALVARYRKLHLFDVDVPGARFLESADVAPGDEVVAVDSPVGRLGLSICYDLRFPELYRELRDRGAEVLCAPAAFTAATGAAHWDVLTRARAIEQQCYLLAPAQWGEPVPGRACFGHARVVDPWGGVLAERASGSGYAIAEVDLAALARVRRGMPVREHRRLR